MHPRAENDEYSTASSGLPSPTRTSTVLVIGMGDMGERLAYRLAGGGRVRRCRR